MTIDAVRAGLRVVEIPIDGLEHRPTYRTPRFLHRGWQAGTSRRPSCLGCCDDHGRADEVGAAPRREPPRRAGPRVLGIALAIDAVVWTLVVATIQDIGAAG